MLKNYFITAWRNLLKNKLNASINITGLSVAFICSMLLFLTVYYEFSYDQFHKNKNTLYRVYNLSHAPDGEKAGGSMSFPAAPAIKAEVQGVEKATPYMYGGNGIRYKGKEVDRGIILVNNDFFGMFTFPVVAGNTAAPLSSTSNIVLSKSTADAVFGQESPIGKTVQAKIGGEWKQMVVSSVVEDNPDNSSIRYDMLARIELADGYANNKNNWNNQNHTVFVQLAPNATLQQAEGSMRMLVKKYHLYDEAMMKSQGYHKDANGDMMAYKLAPFGGLHFNEQVGYGATVSLQYLYTLMLIAVIVLIIACSNFINLNVARAFTRAREVGVRKTIGAGKRQIFLQLWAESFLLCTLALVIALFATWCLLQPFNALFREKLKLGTLMQPAVVAWVVAGMVLVSLVAGGYPAWMVSRFKVVEVLKGKVSVNQSVFLRNGLITFQFIMASLLICGTFIIYRQFEFLRNAPLGFEQESVISIPIKSAEKSGRYIRQLRLALAAQPQVVSVSGASANLGIGEDHSSSVSAIGFAYKGKQIGTNALNVDYDYLKTIGVKLLAGRDFSPAYPADTSAQANNVVVTESMAKQFGVKDALGLSFSTDSAQPNWNIIGIVPDFHFYGMHDKIVPITFFMNKGNGIDYIFVKVKTNNPVQSLAMIKAAYAKIEPDNTTNASYLTENTRRWYEKEQRLSTIFFCSAAIAVLLSCLGLFAIVQLVMQQRRKEIGVRKVLGASIAEITTLLSRDFLALVLVAFVIATPVAWYFLNKWLEDFTYKVDISWWIFPAAGVATLLIALVTVGVQTIRASLANPVKSLRTE